MPERNWPTQSLLSQIYCETPSGGSADPLEHGTEMRPMLWSDVSGGPRTHVGLWLRALLRRDSEAYRRLVHKLNRGEKGWNADEPAVVEGACQLAVRQFFGTYHHVPIDDFVTDMRSRIAKER